MSLDGVLLFPPSYWLFFYIAILKTFVETYIISLVTLYLHSDMVTVFTQYHGMNFSSVTRCD